MRSRPFFLFSEYTVPESHRAEVDAQCRRDMLARQKSTLLFNPGLFILVALGTLLEDPTLQKVILLCTLTALLAVAIFYRYWALMQFGKAIEAPMHTQWLHLYLSLAASASVWGLFLALSLLPTPVGSNFALVYAGTVGLTAGAVMSLSLKSELVRVFILGIMLPAALVSISGYSLQHPGLAGLLVIFAIGMHWVSANARAEYMVSILSNLILQEQSAKLTRLTTVDWLTDVNNRSHFDSILAKELQRVSRIGYPLSLLMADLDHFKLINDTYGHLVGDECLVETARKIKECLKRETDVVARYGGEEFCVLLPGIDQKEAKDLAETIRKYVEAISISHYRNPISITVSIGGATVHGDEGLTRDQLIERADKALYKAKESGRNTVCWHQTP